MIDFFRSQSQEVSIMGDQHPLLPLNISQLSRITRRAQTNLDRRADIDAVLAQRSRNIRVDVFVEMETDPVRHGSTLAVLPAKERDFATKRLDKHLVLLDLPIDLVPVIEIVGHGRINRSQREVVLAGDFLQRLAEAKMHQNHIVHCDSGAGKTRLAPSDSRHDFDMSI